MSSGIDRFDHQFLRKDVNKCGCGLEQGPIETFNAMGVVAYDKCNY